MAKDKTTDKEKQRNPAMEEQIKAIRSKMNVEDDTPPEDSEDDVLEDVTIADAEVVSEEDEAIPDVDEDSTEEFTEEESEEELEDEDEEEDAGFQQALADAVFGKNTEKGPAEDETDEIERITPKHTAEIKLPKRICHVCRHLMPAMPETLPEKFGGNDEDAYGKFFDCYQDDGCPAQHLTIVFNPISEEEINEAASAFVHAGKPKKMNKLLKAAGDPNGVIYKTTMKKLNERITELNAS